MNSSYFPTLSIIVLVLLSSCSVEEEAGVIDSNAANEAALASRSDLLANLPADDDPLDNTFQTLDGRGFDIELFEGQKVFVNFWATWCAPCIREIPSINRAAQALEDENYLFVFVSDEDTDTITEFLDERGFPGNFIKLNGYFGNFGIGAVPSSWLLDENGDIEATWAGAYEWDDAEMLDEIRNNGVRSL